MIFCEDCGQPAVTVITVPGSGLCPESCCAPDAIYLCRQHGDEMMETEGATERPYPATGGLMCAIAGRMGIEID